MKTFIELLGKRLINIFYNIKPRVIPINQRLVQGVKNIWNEMQGMTHPILKNLIGRKMQITNEFHYLRTKISLSPFQY